MKYVSLIIFEYSKLVRPNASFEGPDVIKLDKSLATVSSLWSLGFLKNPVNKLQ